MRVYYHDQMKELQINMDEGEEEVSIQDRACDLFGLSVENVIVECFDQTGNMIQLALRSNTFENRQDYSNIDHIRIYDQDHSEHSRRNPRFSLLGRSSTFLGLEGNREESSSFELGTNFGNELMSIFMTSLASSSSVDDSSLQESLLLPANLRFARTVVPNHRSSTFSRWNGSGNDHPIHLFQHASYEYRQLNTNLTHFEHQMMGMMRDPYQPEEIHLQEQHFLRSIFQTPGSEEESLTSQILSESGVSIFDDLDLTPWFSGIEETEEVDATFLNERVKVVLTEEEYEEIEKKKYAEYDNHTDHQVCVICSDHFQEHDMICITKCKHLLHDECLKPWLTKESKYCPVCRCELGSGKPKDL